SGTISYVMVGVRNGRVVIRVRNVIAAESPEAGAGPGESGQDHKYDGAKRENLHGAVTLGQAREMHRETPIGERENDPRNQTGDQKIPGRAKKSQNRYRRDQRQGDGGDEIPFQRDAFKR